MSSPSTTPLRLLMLLGGCAAALVVLTIAFVDGPDPSHAFRDVVSVHDSMIPRQTRGGVPGGDDTAALEGTLTSKSGDLRFQTWMYRWRGRWASVHRFERPLALPPQSRVLAHDAPERSTFQLGDLTLISWEEPGETWVVAGSDDARGLLTLADRARTRGIDSLSPSTPLQ